MHNFQAWMLIMFVLLRHKSNGQMKVCIYASPLHGLGHWRHGGRGREERTQESCFLPHWRVAKRKKWIGRIGNETWRGYHQVWWRLQEWRVPLCLFQRMLTVVHEIDRNMHQNFEVYREERRSGRAAGKNRWRLTELLLPGRMEGWNRGGRSKWTD